MFPAFPGNIALDLYFYPELSYLLQLNNALKFESLVPNSQKQIFSLEQ